MVQLGQCIAGMLNVGVRHRRVFAQHIHAANIAVMYRIHDLGHGETLLRRKILRFPHIRKGRAHTIIHHRLIIRQEHRYQPGIRRALHIVLTTQRMQPGAGATHLARHQRQRNQAARIVSPVNVLRHTHPPENHTRFCARKGPRHVAQGFRVDAADFCHLLRREISQVFFLSLPILGVSLDILLVIQTLFDNHMHDRVQHCHVGAGAELQHMTGKAAQTHAARVHHDQLATTFGKLLEVGCSHGMVFDRITPDGNCHIRVFNFVEGRAHGTGSDILQQRRNR